MLEVVAAAAGRSADLFKSGVLAIYGGVLRLTRAAMVEHDPERLELDFRKDHAQTKG
jgi:hypothetical protein